MRKVRHAKPLPAFVAVFAACLVVGLVVAAVYLAQTRRSSEPSSPSGAAMSAAPTSTTAAMVLSHGLLLANESAVTLVWPDGRMERMTYASFKSRYPDMASWPVAGTNVATGAKRPIEIQADGLKRSEGFMSEDRAYRVRLLPPKTDGATVIEVQRGQEPARSLVLRTKQSAPLKDGQLYGWFDTRSLMLAAMGTSTRAVYRVELDGRSELVGTLPDDAMFFSASEGILYAMTGLQEAGLENPPTGPSDVYAFDANGARGSIFHSDGLVASFFVNPFVPGQQSFAYVDGDGQAWVMTKGVRVSLAAMRPLAFLSDHEIVLRDGFSLVVKDLQTASVRRIGELPEGSVVLFLFNP